MGKLSGSAVRGAKLPGRYGDGDGLFLVVTKSGSASWIVRIQKSGRRRDFGLGSAKKVPLTAARQRAAAIRVQVEAGLDPVLERRRGQGLVADAVIGELVPYDVARAEGVAG